MPKEKIDMPGATVWLSARNAEKRSFLNFANGLRNGWEYVADTL